MMVTATEMSVIVEIIISLSTIRVKLIVLKEEWVIQSYIYGYQNQTNFYILFNFINLEVIYTSFKILLVYINETTSQITSRSKKDSVIKYVCGGSLKILSKSFVNARPSFNGIIEINRNQQIHLQEAQMKSRD
jgi:hypothetical protein